MKALLPFKEGTELRLPGLALQAEPPALPSHPQTPLQTSVLTLPSPLIPSIFFPSPFLLFPLFHACLTCSRHWELLSSRGTLPLLHL